MKFLAFVLVSGLALTALGLAPDPTDPGRLEWYEALRGGTGVNLTPLKGDARFARFIAHPSFARNLVAMKWRYFRLPIHWDDFAGAGGKDDEAAIQAGIGNLRQLVARLREIHLARPEQGGRTLLMVDFHQFKFGRVCGGVGIPAGTIPEEGLSAKDPNCLFLAFGRFWADQGGAQSAWIRFAMRWVRELPRIARENESWLTLGIEPVNEPQFGIDQPLLVPDSLEASFERLVEFVRADPGTTLGRSQLIPFYRRFLEAMAAVDGVEALLERSLMVFEPFMLDYLDPPAELVADAPNKHELSLDGKYAGMRELRALPGKASVPVRWIAAPHHYFGALDEGFTGYLPPELAEVLGRYPNDVFHRQFMAARMEKMSARMKEAGMDMLLGEWGTQTGLKDPEGKPGGYRQWLGDVTAALEGRALGALWWSYDFDRGADQSKFYLLRGTDDSGASVLDGEQILKCSSPLSLARDVFGTCPGL